MAPAQQERRIALLYVEPDFPAGLSAYEAALARRVVVARTLELDRGAWTGALGDGAVGAIVMSGLLAFGVPLDGAGGLQLRDTGDVVLNPAPRGGGCPERRPPGRGRAGAPGRARVESVEVV